MALVAGPASVPVVALHRKSATWWTGTTATEIVFDDAGPVDGAVWIDGGKRLRVGLGTIDLAGKSFAIEPALQSFVRDTKRLGGIAWFPDGTRVALLVNEPSLRTDQKAPPGHDPTKRELVIVSRSCVHVVFAHIRAAVLVWVCGLFHFVRRGRVVHRGVRSRTCAGSVAGLSLHARSSFLQTR